MGNTITRLTHHHKSRHIHHEVSIPVTVSTPPPTHIDNAASHTGSARAAQEVEAPQPRKPSLDPVPEAIIAATESGMISENLLCSSLPSPVLRHGARSQSEPEPVRREGYGYFPAAPGSVGSSESHVQPRHESEVGEGKRGSVGSERKVRWKGMDM